MAITATHPRSWLRSAGTLFLGLIAVVVLSLGTDEILHVLKIYPSWGQPMREPGLNRLALTYRSVYAVIGSCIAARVAPFAPMAHAMALGVVGLVVSAAGIIATSGMDLGPRWYPIALVLTALPCAWLGGVLHRFTQVRENSHGRNA